MKRPTLPGQLLLSVLLLLCAACCSGDTYPLIYFGNVLIADPEKLMLHRAGVLSPAAPAVAADPAGLIWGRWEPSSVAALDSATQTVVARVALPYKPYHLLITPQGKAYVTHSAMTKEGFSLSIVDTKRTVLLRELRPIAGLRTDLAQAAGFVFLATVGVRQDDYLHLYLYRVDTKTDRLSEIKRLSEPGYIWKLAAYGNRLYIGFLPTQGSAGPARVEAMDADTLRLVGVWRQGPGGPALRGLYAGPDDVLLFVEQADGKHGLIVLGPRLEPRGSALSLPGPVARALGLFHDRLVYVDQSFETGNRNVALRFYDLGAGKEVKSISIPAFLERDN